MSINSTQPGYPPTDSLIENNGNVSNIDQLLSVEFIPTSQLSLSETFNPTNMIPSQTSLLSNMQQQNNILRSDQHRFQQRREEQQQSLHLEQQEQRQQRRQHHHRDPEEHRYIGYMLRLGARDPDRFQQELDEQEHQAYLQRRSPTYDEFADEILTERELEEYYFNRMTPQERHQIWEQEHLNQLQGNPEPRVYGLPLDSTQQYANFLQEQQRADEHDQAMRVYDMQNTDYAEEYRKNGELLMQKEQWEEIAFRHQQLQQDISSIDQPIIWL